VDELLLELVVHQGAMVELLLVHALGHDVHVAVLVEVNI